MNGSGDMTLAFELEALQRVADPGAVFTDAREWTQYLGVVSEKPTYVVTNFTRKHRIRQDFFSGPRGMQESLESVKGQFDTDRYVLIGTEDEHATLAASIDWEYLPIEEAADAADWQLEADAEAVGPAGMDDDRDDWP